jgi:hypothetical protein
MNKTKKDKKLRRELEVLKAQLKIDEKKVIKSKLSVTDNSNKKEQSMKENAANDKLIKKDLLKTLMISFVGLSVILSLWIYTEYLRS